MARNKIEPTSTRSFRKPKDYSKATKSRFETSTTQNEPFCIKKSRSEPNTSQNQPFLITNSNKGPSKTSDNNKKDGGFMRRDSFFSRNKKESQTNSDSKEFNRNRNNANKERKFKDGKVEKTDKIPFDKRKWRVQKYSKKYKLEQWEDNRKKAVLREYYKEIRDDKPKIDVQKIYEEYSDDLETELIKPIVKKSPAKQIETKPHNYVRNPNYVPEPDEDGIEYHEDVEETAKNLAKTSKLAVKAEKNKFKNKPNYKARQEFDRLKQEKQTKKEEIRKRKEEKAEALNNYKKKKIDKYRKLNKKNKKGQPLMKNRIEMLLEKIQAS